VNKSSSLKFSSLMLYSGIGTNIVVDIANQVYGGEGIKAMKAHCLLPQTPAVVPAKSLYLKRVS